MSRGAQFTVSCSHFCSSLNIKCVCVCVSAGRYTDIFGKYRYFPIYRYRTVVVFQYRNTEYRGTAKKKTNNNRSRATPVVKAADGENG